MEAKRWSFCTGVSRIRGTPILPGSVVERLRVPRPRWLMASLLAVVTTSAFPVTTQGSVARFPRMATENLPSGTYTLPLGQSATLRLPSSDFQPSISSATILLVPRHTETSTPYREWEMRGVAIGVAELTVTGPSTHLTWRIEVGSGLEPVVGKAEVRVRSQCRS